MSIHFQSPPLKPVNEYRRWLKQPDLLLIIPDADHADDNQKTREIEIPPEDEPEGEDLPDVDDPLDDEPFPEDPLGNDLPEFDPPEEESSDLSRRSPK